MPFSASCSCMHGFLRHMTPQPCCTEQGMGGAAVRCPHTDCCGGRSSSFMMPASGSYGREVRLGHRPQQFHVRSTACMHAQAGDAPTTLRT